jgi:hypothetical protein
MISAVARLFLSTSFCLKVSIKVCSAAMVVGGAGKVAAAVVMLS